MLKRYLSIIISLIAVFICCMVISCDCTSSNPPTDSSEKNSMLNSVIHDSTFDSHMVDDDFPEFDFND